MSSKPVIKVLSSSDNTQIWAEARGNPNGQSLVFVHGMTLSAVVFDKLFEDERLTREFYLVRYDLRGHGRSGKPSNEEGHASSLYADDFVTVCKAFNLNKPIHVGWSLGAAVASDYCQHIDPVPVSGVVYLSGLPYIGPIMGSIGKPSVHGFLPGLFTLDDVVLSRRTTIGFAESVFAHPDQVPFELKCTWMGSAVLQTPNDTRFCITRAQDPAKLLETAAKGLPLLVISGSADIQTDGDALAREMKQHWKNMEYKMIHGAGHAVFYDSHDETIEAIVAFARRVGSTA